MRSFLSLVIGVPVMVGLYYLARFLATGVNEQFGDDVFVGMMLMIAVFWIAWRLNPAAFFSEKDRERLKAQLLDQAIRERHGE